MNYKTQPLFFFKSIPDVIDTLYKAGYVSYGGVTLTQQLEDCVKNANGFGLIFCVKKGELPTTFYRLFVVINEKINDTTFNQNYIANSDLQ